MKILCLSNGHGEDAIALRVLRQLQQHPHSPDLAALPLVGDGRAYLQLPEVEIVGPVKPMPSGGFVYMDGRQLLGDISHGLLGLTWKQYQAIRQWAKQGDAVLAVGDIVPLLFARLSGLPYAFIGTAKSEYYLRDEAGVLPRRTWFERLESWSGSVYLPWERALMRNKRCRAVFPRDALTTETLQQFSIPAYDLGNPMMDDLEVDATAPIFYDPDAELKETQRSLVVTLLPGSRAPEAYGNWQQILWGLASVVETFNKRHPVILAAIAPGLNIEHFSQELENYGWHRHSSLLDGIGDNPGPSEIDQAIASLQASGALTFTQKTARLLLTQTGFVECLRYGDVAIAMAGTATEQFVGLGKPAIALPGKGPQFTPAFAEAQSRLLGPSVTLVKRPDQVAEVIQQLLRDPDLLQLIGENGQRRMGEPGASQRIATHLMEGFNQHPAG
ncbi:lipid-A-disaccharide synthase-related protein [Laspinema sp. A4]|uniref:lipid-A-disaccharide synthase-related protein n=1 Tax=Laspinema sp. D2d TaxID=2953686 RepID=UPI0021BA8514|nr:lipid-A-disaccharide synthase-related protein [Laspinema sp. D2d]MCT7986105.1 lipid-A-disaccharide synthase-related protein [Laspinema sp. D2d]